jgi:hypothetical protein
MAEELATVPTPTLPKTGQIGFKEAMGVQEPFVKRKAELQKGITEAEGDIAKATQAQSEVLQSGKMQAQKEFGAAQEGAMQGLQQKLEAEPLPAFIPTKDTAQDLAGLFSIVSVIGMIAGKSNGQQAMNAMNGMLEGYQKGRGDLYKKEAAEFDKNFKAMLSKHAEFRKEMEDAVKLAATNKEAGMQAAELAATKAGSSIVQAQLRKGDLLGAYKLVDESGKGADKALTLESNVRQKAADRAAADERARLQRVQAKELAQIKADSAGKTTKSNATQQQFENITSADIGNAYFRINEYLASSKNGKIPEGSKFLRDKGTQSGIVDAYKNYAVNATLPSDLQKNDATLLGIAFDVVAARAFGRASGVTDSKIAQVVRQLPVQGDSEETKQTKMRILLNQLEEPNKLLPEEKRKNGADYMRSPVAKSVYSVYAEQPDEPISKSEASIARPEKSYSSEAEATKAFESGKLKAGEKVIINGVKGTWE